MINNEPHFYLQLTIADNNKHCGWVFFDPMISHYLAHPSALYAEAFSLRRVENARHTVQMLMGGAFRVVPVECSSRVLLTEQMKKVINL